MLIKHADIVRHIKTQRIRWIRHIVKLDKERMMTSVTEWRSITVRRQEVMMGGWCHRGYGKNEVSEFE